jgi:hypothetical protein
MIESLNTLDDDFNFDPDNDPTSESDEKDQDCCSQYNSVKIEACYDETFHLGTAPETERTQNALQMQLNWIAPPPLQIWNGPADYSSMLEHFDPPSPNLDPEFLLACRNCRPSTVMTKSWPYADHPQQQQLEWPS